MLVPAGIADFPDEIARAPRAFVATKYRDLVTFNDMEAGGHFAAFEEPALVHGDFVRFVEKVEERKTKKKGERSEL